MLTVAYLANQFPSPFEGYVTDEIEELRRRGIRVIAGSVRPPANSDSAVPGVMPEIVLTPLRGIILLKALVLCVQRCKQVAAFLTRILFCGKESPLKRLKALAHTWLGACYAVLLEERGVGHIHVHHGYFGAWIAMVAARLLDIQFSMTLHGSDLLLHATYLDVKLAQCAFCLTVSDYNRRYILKQFPSTDTGKVLVAHLGVEVSDALPRISRVVDPNAKFTILTVGRLHPVKNHTFLVDACARLQALQVDFTCSIAGDGPELGNLRSKINDCELHERVKLLGQVARKNMDALYEQVDAVVLTSLSEGIPLVLMEAMARGKIVLAPAITGIPELVIAEKTGFLYRPGSLDDFVSQLLFISSLSRTVEDLHSHRCDISQVTKLNEIRESARLQVWQKFNRRKNLEEFADLFLNRIASQAKNFSHENFVLQQM